MGARHLFPILLALLSSTALGQWTQFGGPERNFHAPASELADAWPEIGPPVVWRRGLGDGYSGILVDGDRLYTLERRGGAERVLSLKRDDGATLWEHAYEVVTHSSAQQFGDGPSATPAIAGNKLVTCGVGIDLHAFDKLTGELLWRRDIMEEFDIPMPGRGHSTSPLIIDDLVIVTIGGRAISRAIDDSPNLGIEGGAVMAFDLVDGGIVWASQDFPSSKASPIAIELDGSMQVVVFMGNELAGLDPEDGTLLWSHPHATDYGFNCTTPVFDGVDTLFCTSSYGKSAEAVRLVRKGESYVPERVWASRRLSVHFTNILYVEGRLYGVSGMGRPGLMTCLDAKTGKMLWRERGFSKANLVYADGHFVVLDEDGRLSLARFEDEGPVVTGRFEVSDSHAFTAPTLVESELYVRDRSSLTRFDISPAGLVDLRAGRAEAFQRELPELPAGTGSWVGTYATSSSGQEPDEVRVHITGSRFGITFAGEDPLWLEHARPGQQWEVVADRTSGSTPRRIEFANTTQETSFVLRSPRQKERTYRRISK